MTEREIEEIFNLYGHADMYEKLKNKLQLTSLLDNDGVELLESFFSSYNFGHGATMSYEEFEFHIRVFKLLEEQGVLPEVFY
ncbi:MAG: hypothetical protein ACQEUT_16630 [Bacillota bacterium]